MGRRQSRQRYNNTVITHRLLITRRALWATSVLDSIDKKLLIVKIEKVLPVVLLIV